jgi:hypothetical protein
VRRPTRRPRRGTALTAIAATVALVGACGGHSGTRTAPTTALTTPPTVPATTTTTRPKPKPKPAPTAPLAGLRPANRAQLSAPAVVVKIDNVDAARPQTGPNQADVVYEEEVEGGLTRLAAVFQSQYPAVVGPVRSGRLTDEGIADDLNHPVFAYSGTNGIFLPILRSQPLTDVDDDNHPGLFYRSNLGVEPHNLYSSVASLAGASTTHAPPPALFHFVPAHGRFTGPGLASDAHIGLAWPAAAVTWDWNASSRAWLRGQNGSADTDRSGAQLSATNVIVQFVSYITSGIATGEGGPPAPIPEGILVGGGPAWYFSNGEVVKGTWHRSSLTATTVYLNAARAPVQLTPGRTWVELVPVGTNPTLVP